jgi:hypothetical protein
MRELLAAQAGHATTLRARQPDRFGSQGGSAGAQERCEVVDGHPEMIASASPTSLTL